jgi:hypothetical protein
MYRSLSCYVAVVLNVTMFSTANGEDDGKWELEEHPGVILALSYKQSATINDQIVSSGLAFLCDQKARQGIAGAMLLPLNGTFEDRQDSIPVSIQKKSDEFGQSDLLQKWKNGSEFLFSDVKDDVADLIALLKERDREADRSVHFYFPNGLDNGQQTSNHIVVDASGFATKFEEFENDCTSGQ